MRSIGRIFIVAAALLGLTVGGPTASAAPQGPWVQPAVDLSAPGQNASNPQISTTSDGVSTAVWSRSNGSRYVIQAANRPPGANFGLPVDLSAAGQSAQDPQISTAPDGTSFVVWHSFNGSEDIIQVAIRPPGGIFGPPADLSAAGQTAADPQISTDPDGTTTVIWYRYNGANFIVQAATRPPGGTFGPPADLSAAGQSAVDAQINSGPDGTATVVWQRSNGFNNMIQAATRPSGGSFGPPVDLSVAGRNAFSPQITTATNGTATAVWFRSDGSNDIVQAATRPPGGSFGTPVDLSAAGRNAFNPQITTVADGTATVAWSRNNGSHNIVQAATRPSGGSFGTPVDLSAVGQGAYIAQITAAADSTATVLWFRYDGTNNIVQAATRPPGGSFGSAVDLSGIGQNAGAPRITTSPDGTATAVWRRFNGTINIIQSISTARPSPLLGVSKAGSGNGKVTSAPPGIDCGVDCAENYLSFTKVSLTATADPGSTFTGWGGACAEATGNTCELTMLEDANATANFKASQSLKAKLKITKVKPGKPQVKRGKTVKLKVTGGNAGKTTVSGVKLCLRISKSTRKKLKLSGKSCRTLGSLGPGKAETRSFKVKSTGKAKRGRKYKVTIKLSANGAAAVTRAVKVKVK